MVTTVNYKIEINSAKGTADNSNIKELSAK